MADILSEIRRAEGLADRIKGDKEEKEVQVAFLK
jgi:hypothetical protein